MKTIAIILCISLCIVALIASIGADRGTARGEMSIAYMRGATLTLLLFNLVILAGGTIG